MLDIYTLGEDVLREECSDIKEFDEEFGSGWRTSYQRTECGAIVKLLPVPSMKNDEFDALCTGFASSVDIAEKKTA